MKNNRKNEVSSISSIGATAILSVLVLLMSTARVEAEQPTDVEDVRRELRQLRAQVQLLRSALSEAAELDSQRAATLSRALKAIPASADSAPSKSREDVAEKGHSEPPAPAPVAVAPTAQSSRSSRRTQEASKKVVEAAPSSGSIRGKVNVPKGEPVAFVYVENVSAPAVKDQHYSIEQLGKKFVPSWAVVQRGAVISFPNRDNIYHNVFSLSSGNSFDLGLYSAGESKSHTFNEAGEVEIYCNIHPQMVASALVVPNRLYAKVKSDGTFEITGVPTGRRKVVAWAPGSRFAVNWAEVQAGDTAQVDFTLESKASGHKNKSGQQYGSYE